MSKVTQINELLGNMKIYSLYPNCKLKILTEEGGAGKNPASALIKYLLSDVSLSAETPVLQVALA